MILAGALRLPAVGLRSRGCTHGRRVLGDDYGRPQHHPQRHTQRLHEPGCRHQLRGRQHSRRRRSDHEKVIVPVSDGMPVGSTAALTEQYRNETVARRTRRPPTAYASTRSSLTLEEYGQYGYGGADFEFNEGWCATAAMPSARTIPRVSRTFSSPSGNRVRKRPPDQVVRRQQAGS